MQYAKCNTQCAICTKHERTFFEIAVYFVTHLSAFTDNLTYIDLSTRLHAIEYTIQSSIFYRLFPTQV